MNNNSHKVIFSDKDMPKNGEDILIYLKDGVSYLMYKEVEHNLEEIIKNLKDRGPNQTK